MLNTATQILIAVLGTGGGGLLIYLYRRRDKRKRRISQWYQDAISLCGRVQRLGHRVTEYQAEADTDMLQQELDPLSDEIEAHASGAPDGVPEPAIDDLRFLSKITTGLSIMADLSEDHSSAELLELFQELTQRKLTRGEDMPSMNEVNQLISDIEFDAISDDLPEPETFDEADVADILQEVDQETRETGQIQTIDEAINFPFGQVDESTEGVDLVDEVMDETMIEYLRLWMIDITGEVYSRLEDQQYSASQ